MDSFSVYICTGYAGIVLLTWIDVLHCVLTEYVAVKFAHVLEITIPYDDLLDGNYDRDIEPTTPSTWQLYVQ